MRWSLLVSMILSCCLIVGLLPAQVSAKNGSISYWTSNISERNIDEIWGMDDFNPEIAVSGQTVHALWMADSVWTPRNIFYRRSLDGGQTWESRQMIFSDDRDNILGTPYLERLAVDGDTVHVLINGYGHGNNWYGKLTYIRSIDNGQSFQEPRVIYLAGESCHALDSRIRARDGQVAILFRAQKNWNTEHSARLLISEDGGDTFRDVYVYGRDDGTGWSVVDLCWQDDIMYVLYYDSYYYYGLQYGNLYLSSSTDGGDSFESRLISVPSSTETHKTYGPFAGNSSYVPKIAASGNTVFVVWSGDDENDIPSIFVRRSTDNGRNWDDAVNLTRDHLPEGLTIQPGQETIAAKKDFIYVIFNTSYGQLFFSCSGDAGMDFEPIRQISKSTGTRHIDSGWSPGVLTDPSDPTGMTVHFLWSWFSHDCSSDAGVTFRGPALLSPHFSWNGSGPSLPRWVITPDRQIHIVQQGSWSYYSSTGYGDQDIFYRRYDLDTPEESGENQALHLTYMEADYETGQERYDNMQIPPHADLSFCQALTAEFWFRLDSDAPLKAMRLLVKENQSSSYSLPTGYQIGLNPSDVQHPNGGIKTTTGQYMVWSDYDMVPGVWTHLALTYDSTFSGNNLLLYVNGELSASTAATGSIIDGEGILFLGAVREVQATQGSFDEVRLWERAVPAQEIKDNMGFRLTGTERGLVAYYPLDGTTRDMTGNGHDGVLMYKESFFVTDWHSAPLGDVNGDGGLNVLDMVAIANHIMSIITLGEQEQALADCNGDGNVNVLDMLAIANVILHIFEKCPGNGCRPVVTPEVLELMESMESYLSPEVFAGIMTLVKEFQLPTEFGLAQNYPNPFNPKTEIRYQIADGRYPLHTTLKLYNILGQEVVTLVDEVQEPGYYTVTWDASEMASGIYFYRLNAGKFSAIKRMVLMK